VPLVLRPVQRPAVSFAGPAQVLTVSTGSGSAGRRRTCHRPCRPCL